MPTPVIKNQSKVLRVPREIRDQIYTYLLTIDRGPEGIPDSDNERPLSINLLRVSRQTRAEALKVLKEGNIWITCELRYQARNEVPHMLNHVLFEHYPRTRHVRLNPMTDNGLFRDSTLFISAEKRPRQGGLYSYSDIALMAYNERNFYQLCFGLCQMAPEIVSIKAKLSHHPLIQSRAKLQAKLLEPLTVIRKMRRATVEGAVSREEDERIGKAMQSAVTKLDDAIKVLTAVRQLGDRAMQEQKYDEAVLHYENASSMNNVLSNAMLTDEVAGEAERNLYTSLHNDSMRLICEAANMLVESRREKNSGKIINMTCTQLDYAISDATISLDWSGILDTERAWSHYHRGIAIKNRADYEKTYGDLQIAHETYEDAARDLYYATHLMPDNKRMQDSLREVDGILGRRTTEEHAPVFRTLLKSNHENVVWEGDVRLWDSWGSFGTVSILNRRLRPA